MEEVHMEIPNTISEEKQRSIDSINKVLDAPDFTVSHVNRRQTIIIADDDEMNLDILKQVFQDEFKIALASDGNDAIEQITKHSHDACCILLDINMPIFSGYQILQYIRRTHVVERIPIILITAQNDKQTELDCYNLGAQAYITKPFNVKNVRQQVHNIIVTYQELDKKIEEVEKQRQRLAEYNSHMLEVVANLVEDRSEESGLHVKRVKEITRLLATRYKKLYSEIGGIEFTNEYIDQIAEAAMLHDIGKIYIPDSVLNKPGRLTPEERVIMESHAQKGAEIIQKYLSNVQDNVQLKLTVDICYCHHERYDGAGYPRKLKGDEIPITAQIVSLADVYDALVSDRCYRKAFDYATAYQMIIDGKSGVFNPKLLNCLKSALSDIESYSKKCKAA